MIIQNALATKLLDFIRSFAPSAKATKPLYIKSSGTNVKFQLIGSYTIFQLQLDINYPVIDTVYNIGGTVNNFIEFFTEEDSLEFEANERELILKYGNSTYKCPSSFGELQEINPEFHKTKAKIKYLDYICGKIETYQSSIKDGNSSVLLSDKFIYFTGRDLIHKFGAPVKFDIDIVTDLKALREISHGVQEAYLTYTDSYLATLQEGNGWNEVRYIQNIKTATIEDKNKYKIFDKGLKEICELKLSDADRKKLIKAPADSSYTFEFNNNSTEFSLQYENYSLTVGNIKGGNAYQARLTSFQVKVLMELLKEDVTTYVNVESNALLFSQGEKYVAIATVVWR